MKTTKRISKRVLLGAFGLFTATSLLASPLNANAAAEDAAQPLILTVTAQADTASLQDGVDSYQVEVINNVGGEAKRITVQVPFASGYTLAGASFNQSNAWVSNINNGMVTISVDSIQGEGTALVGDLRFTGQGSSNAIAARATVSNDEDTYQSNMPTRGVSALAIVERAGSTITFSGGAFAPGEAVNFWYTTANGVSVPLYVKDGYLVLKPADNDDDEAEKVADFLTADSTGAITAMLNTASLPAGGVTLAARGNWSESLAALWVVAR